MSIITYQAVENKIITLRGLQVILDSDAAELYQIETKRINEAVKNNPEKFPDTYLMKMTQAEWVNLKSKFSTSNRGGKVKLPVGFPERGLYMLATILKSAKATQATFAIIETVTKIRELASTIKSLSVVKDDARQKTLMQRSGQIVSEIFDEALQTSDTDHRRSGTAWGSLPLAA